MPIESHLNIFYFAQNCVSLARICYKNKKGRKKKRIRCPKSIMHWLGCTQNFLVYQLRNKTITNLKWKIKWTTTIIITLVWVPIIWKRVFFLRIRGMRGTKNTNREVDYGTCGESWGDFWEEEGCELDGAVSRGFSAIVDDLDHAQCVSVWVSLNLKMNEMKIEFFYFIPR